MNWILVTNILILVMLIGAFVGAFLFIRPIYKEFVEFLTPPADDVPSPLSQALASLANLIARTMAVEVKTTIMGMLSGQARGEQALTNAETQLDLAMDNPAIAGVVEMLPKSLKKSIYKNPAIAKLVASKLGGMFTQPMGGVPAGGDTVASGNGKKAKFNL